MTEDKLTLPTGTPGPRPSTPSKGMIRPSVDCYQIHDGEAWVDVNTQEGQALFAEARGEKKPGKNWNCQVIFEPRNLWLGVYWNLEGHCLDIYICLLPCLPIHFSYWWTDPRQ